MSADAPEEEPRSGIARIPTLAALAHHEFRLIWTGLAATNMGYWAQIFAQGWLVVELAVAEGNPHLAPFYLGLVNLARGIPGVTVGLYAGVVADRFDRRRIVAWAQIPLFIVGLALALITISGHATVLWLVILGGLSACAQAFDVAPRQAMLPRLVPPRDLISAIGLNQMVWHGSTLLGPLFGGLVIGSIGVGGIFLIKAFSHVPILLACLSLSPQPPEAGARRGGNPFSAIGEAVRFVLVDPVLRWSMVLLLALAALVRPYMSLMPSITHDVLGGGAQELSWLLAASGLGSLFGAALIAPIGGLRRRGLLLAVATVVTGALLLAFALQRSFLPALLLIMAVGGTTLVGFGIATGFLQVRSPDALRGRVMALQNISFNGLNPIGVMVIGSLAAFVGVANAEAIAAGVVLAAGLAALAFSPVLRNFGAGGGVDDRPLGGGG